MHPIEHLRMVARARGTDPADLVRETAYALSGLGPDAAELLVACRQILARHPHCAPLWWLCAQVLAAPDWETRIWDWLEHLESEATLGHLVRAVPEDATVVTLPSPPRGPLRSALARRGDLQVLDAHPGRAVAQADLVLLEAAAAGSRTWRAVAGSAPLVALAHLTGRPVWVVLPAGHALADATIDHLERQAACEMDPLSHPFDHMPVDWVDVWIGPHGRGGAPQDVADAAPPVLIGPGAPADGR